MNRNTESERLWESHVCVDDFIQALAPDFAWLADYAGTPQDPEWHAEGNVHIHVDWVLQALRELLAGEAAHLSYGDKTILTLAALLHDVGKPVTTREAEIQGRQRIAAPQHEAVGASYLFHQPIPFGLSADAWQQVIALTGYHHFPKRLVVRNRPHGEYAALSRRARPDLLYWLERADMRGRECHDRQEQLDIIELYRMECEAAGVWLEDPYQDFRQMLEEAAADVAPTIRRRLFLLAVQAYERGDIFMLEEGLARFYRFREPHPHVVVLCGASAAGKSHYTHSQYPDYAVVSPDAVRESLFGSAEHQGDSGQVFQAAQEALRVHLRAQRSVVWDATNLRRDNRERVIGLARDYGAFVSLVALQKPRALLHRHNRERERQVPEAVLEHQLRRFQLPDLDEAHEVLFVPAAEPRH